MSSMSSVAGLSKYIRTLPKAKSTLLMIIVTSFIIGSVLFLVKPMSIGSGLENFLYGGAFGFVVFGLPAIITGSTDQKWVDSLNGINHDYYITCQHMWNHFRTFDPSRLFH